MLKGLAVLQHGAVQPKNIVPVMQHRVYSTRSRIIYADEI
jgi:hypothetical protein